MKVIVVSVLSVCISLMLIGMSMSAHAHVTFDYSNSRGDGCVHSSGDSIDYGC